MLLCVQGNVLCVHMQENCLVYAQRCALCVHVLFVHRGVCYVCTGEVSCFCTEVCVMCVCLVCVERFALCGDVLFVHRGVRCVCTGEVSCLCIEGYVVCAQEKCLVFAQRCVLCVHRRSVKIVCAQRCVFQAFTANVISYSLFPDWGCLHFLLIAFTWVS